MAESLLASLYTRIRGSQEDVATVSLQYILSSSNKLNAAFNKLLSDSLKLDISADIRYSCQSVGENKERPDMSGVDDKGNEVILCEMKFYAGLTDNQPNGYLDRLKNKGGQALVFVCPDARKISLWHKILELCNDQGRKISGKDEYRVTVDGISMCIVTWNKVIDELRRVAASEALESKSDIDQLAGFCSMMDSTAFIPFSPEDMGSIVARKEERNYQVIDKLFDKVCANKALHPNAKSLRAAAWRGGYTRYIRIEGYNLALIYNRNAWIDNSREDTPFWFYFTDDGWKQSDELRNKLRNVPESQTTLIDIDNKICLALHPLFHATLDEVVDDLLRQILERINSINNVAVE